MTERFRVNLKNIEFTPDYKVNSNTSDYQLAEHISNPEIQEVMMITSYPPRECGIANYSFDLIRSIKLQFSQSYLVSVCALINNSDQKVYDQEVKLYLNTESSESYLKTAERINNNKDIHMVVIQHEFGFFESKKNEFIEFVRHINVPVIIVYHTVLPAPDPEFRAYVGEISDASDSIVVMTNFSSVILKEDYGINTEKITVIPHGTHLVSHHNKKHLKHKYHLSGKSVLSTFGLISEGKSIETTLKALPSIIVNNPDLMFLIIGKTHPTVLQNEDEKYRKMLESMVDTLKLHDHVRFINQYLELPVLLEYLQLTDIYLFTSKDPNQAVSGTFSYAISSGCPIISTPIPHAKEVLGNDAGIIIEFENFEQLSKAAIQLLNDENLRKNISLNGLQRMAETAWENSAIAHAYLFKQVSKNRYALKYNIPQINLNHIKKISTGFGIIQFSQINQPDITSGYTLDDNARAMIAMCQHYELTKDPRDLLFIKLYLNFIVYCFTTEGYFLNYVNEEKQFTDQNNSTNLADSNGRAIWALGYLISLKDIMPDEYIDIAHSTILKALPNIHKIHSTRAMAFVIKGLYYFNQKSYSPVAFSAITEFANRMVQMYRHENDNGWCWFESYLTYANSLLPESLLCAYLATEDKTYKDIAEASLEFLISKTFRSNRLNVVSNKNWLHKDEVMVQITSGGEQPIDVAYTVIALCMFYQVFKDEKYFDLMQSSFDWFLGNNHLHQIVYNPCTGGCYDGLEDKNINLNQGAESSISYLMAKLTIEKLLMQKSEATMTQNAVLESNF